MAKVIKPQLEDYLEETNGQGIGSMEDQSVSVVNNENTVRVISHQSN